MKEKILKIILISFSIIVFMGNHFILLGSNVVQAIYEELEMQNGETTNKNVLFDVFLLEQDNKVYQKISSIGQGEILKVNVSVNSGIFTDGKIIIPKSLVVQKDLIKNEYVSLVDEQTGEVFLNTIQNQEIAQIEIPVKLNKQDYMNIDYFDQEISVDLMGNYKDGDKTPETVKGAIKLKISWTEEASILVEQKIDKMLKMQNEKLLLQQRVEVRCKSRCFANRK